MTIKFKASFQKARIDKKAWLTEMSIGMERTLEESLVAWLNAATAPIPAWSGASLGTFSDLAARVNFVLRIAPTSLGAQVGEGPDAGRSQSTGSISVNKSQGLFQAQYSTSLEHLIFNEFNNANLGGDPNVFSRLKTPGPYGFLELGRVAFENAARRGELPNEVKLKIKKREV